MKDDELRNEKHEMEKDSEPQPFTEHKVNAGAIIGDGITVNSMEDKMKKQIIKDLRIVFTKEEKTLENLNRVLEVLGDEWEEKEKKCWISDNYYFIAYDIDDKLYKYGELMIARKNTELSLIEFFNTYDNKDYIVNSMEDLNELPTTLLACKNCGQHGVHTNEPHTCLAHMTKCDGRWNGYYTKASVEAYGKLLELGYKADFVYTGNDSQFQIINCKFFAYTKEVNLFSRECFLEDGEFTDIRIARSIGSFEEMVKVVEQTSPFAIEVRKIADGLAELLIEKNAKYGNSALEPKRIFSKASAVEQILVRIDDKLSRISNQSDLEDEDVVEDLLGYLVLFKIAKSNVL